MGYNLLMNLRKTLKMAQLKGETKLTHLELNIENPY